MKLFVQEEIVETIGNEPIPPAEVVAYEQYRPAGRIDAALERDIIEMTLQSGPRIIAEEPDKEGNMSRFYNHFELLTGTSDFTGLRYKSGTRGNPPSSAGLNC